MRNVDWSSMTLWALHGLLMLGAAYATARSDKWGWAVPPLMALASGAQAPSWLTGHATPAAPAPVPSGLTVGTDPNATGRLVR